LIVTAYADSLIWKYKNDFTKDMRNSEFNIQRNYYMTNPASSIYGQVMTKSNVDATTLTLWEPRMTPITRKFVRAVPKGLTKMQQAKDQMTMVETGKTGISCVWQKLICCVLITSRKG
jgi:hypothetical protein